MVKQKVSPKVGVIMGSDSDLPVMEEALESWMSSKSPMKCAFFQPIVLPTKPPPMPEAVLSVV